MASINTPLEVIRVQQATNIAASPTGNENITNTLGRYARTAQSVQVSPSQADTSDMQEEAGMGVAARGKQDLEKTKLRKSQGANLEALARIADYLDKLPDMPSEQMHRDLVLKFQQYEDLMRNAGGGGGSNLPTADDIRALLRDYDGDVSHQFAALEDIRARATKSDAPAAYLALLDTVRAELRQPETARDIAAGFASAREAATVGDRFGSDPQSYRDSYRNLLRESPSLGRTFDELRKFSLTEKFDAVVDSFMKVAGDELASAGPSTEPAQLNLVLKELSSLKNLRSVFDGANQMLAKIERMFANSDNVARPSGEDITSRLFHFSGAAVASMTDAERLISGFETTPPEVPVVAVNLIRDLHASLPDQVIHSNQAREHQSKLLMSLSERFVDIEDAAYNS